MNSLQFTPLDPLDVTFVLDHLWRRGEDEAARCGLKTRQDLLVHLSGIMQEHSYAMRIAGEPVAVFGATHKDGKYLTWFLATDRFGEAGVAATRFLRGFIKEKIKSRPDAGLELVSAVDHPDAGRWFKVLGFDEVRREGAFTQYRYQRKAG